MSRYSPCIVTSGQPGHGHVTIQLIVSRQRGIGYGRWLCRDTTQPGLQHDHASARHKAKIRRLACNTVGHRAATQPGHGHDTAQRVACACNLSALRAAWAHCARLGRTYACSQGQWVCTCAPNPVLDTVHYFSNCLDHCSWTLFTRFFKKIKI